MKKLILSGALVLCAATSCTVAKAQWQESAPRVEASTGAPTPSPSSGAGDDYTWNVNGIPAGGINGTGNQVSYTADLKNGRGDVLPELTESTLRTGASLLKTWNWTGMGAQPTTVTATHAAYCNSRLSVYLPSPRDNGTYPLSKARVVFYANPGKMPTPENGTYTSIARFKAGDLNAVETLFILNDGAANEQAQPGQGTRYISFTSTNTKTMFNFRNGQRDSVEVQIRGYAKADGRMIPVGTFGSAYSNGSIATTQYSLR